MNIDDNDDEKPISSLGTSFNVNIHITTLINIISRLGSKILTIFMYTSCFKWYNINIFNAMFFLG